MRTRWLFVSAVLMATAGLTLLAWGEARFTTAASHPADPAEESGSAIRRVSLGEDVSTSSQAQQLLSWKRSSVWTGDQSGPQDSFGRYWYDPSFNDSSWTSAPVPDTGFNFEANDRYYRAHFNWDGTSDASVYFVSDDGLSIYINGQWLGMWGNGWRQSGCINSAPTCINTTTVPVQTIPAWMLQPGDNVIAVDLWNAANCCFYYFDIVLSAGGPLPIVFVHGWQGWPVQFFGCSDADKTRLTDNDLANGSFEIVDDDLQVYYPGYYAHLVTNRCYTPSLQDNVPNLIEAIDRAKSGTGKSQVILIGHSMGGLVARAYLEGPQYAARKDVAALFTFGSPHQGVPEDLIVFFANGVSLGRFCEDKQPALCDFSEFGMALFNQWHRQPSGVTYHAISGDAPPFPFNARLWAMRAIIPGPDDGTVPTESGRGVPGTADRWTTDEVHSDGLGPRSYFIRDGGQSTSYTQCLKKVLVDKTANNCGGVSALQEIGRQDTSDLSERTPFEYGTLLTGQTVTRTIPLEGGPTLFAAQWETGTLALSLLDPNGLLIDPAFAVTHPISVAYQSAESIATYYLTETIPGAWQLVLQGSSVPTEGSAYTTFAAFDSAVALKGGTDKIWYLPGASAIITASLSGNPSNASVTAAILRADGVTDTLSLSALGGGQYQAVYTVPAAPGYAEVRLVAAGASSGLPFERGANLAFQISPNTVALSNVYSDTPHPRSPGSYYYQALTVTVGINSSVSTTLGLSADLTDAGGSFVAHSAVIRDVVTGTSTLALRFDAGDIYAAQRNGPYKLTDLLLTDQRGAVLVIAEAQNVFTTSAYDYRRFGRGKVFLPVVLRNN